MAITATIALNPATITAGGPGATATVTVSNSATGGPAVPILGYRPLVYNHGSTQKDEAAVMDGGFSPGMNGNAAGSVPFGGTAVFAVPLNAFQPQYGSTALQYDVTCEIVMGDGSIVYPTVAVLTVNPSPHS